MRCACAAIVKSAKGPSNGNLFTEEDWNDESSLTEGPYSFSKVWHVSSMHRIVGCHACSPSGSAFSIARVGLQAEAERAAWEVSKAEGFDLVTINPTFVLGPVIGDRADATSIVCFKACPPCYFCMPPA